MGGSALPIAPPDEVRRFDWTGVRHVTALRTSIDAGRNDEYLEEGIPPGSAHTHLAVFVDRNRHRAPLSPVF